MNSLTQDYPIVLRDVYCGVELPPGWIKLVRGLCQQLEEIAATQPTDKQLQVVQIKQKFGALRCYVENPTREALYLVAAAERASATVCEVCSGIGSGHQLGHYVITLCEQCYKQRKK